MNNLHMKFKPSDLILLLVLITVLGIFTQNMGFGTNGLFFSIIAAIVAVKGGPLLVIELRKRQRTPIPTKPSAAEFLFRPPRENFRPPFDPFAPRALPEASATVRLRVRRSATTVTGSVEATGQPGQKSSKAAAPEQEERVERRSLLLSESTAVDRSVFATTGMFVHPTTDPTVTCVLAEEIATHGPLLLITTRPARYVSLVSAVPHGYLIGSAHWKADIPRPYHSRFHAITSREQAEQTGKMMMQDNLQVVFNPLSYCSGSIEEGPTPEEEKQALNVFFGLLKGILDWQAARPTKELEPFFLFVADAEDFVPGDEVNSIFGVPDIANRIKRQIMVLLEKGDDYGCHVQLSTAELDAIEPDAMDLCTHWAISVVPNKNAASWIWAKTHVAAGVLAKIASQGTLMIDKSNTTIAYVQFRAAHSFLWAVDEGDEDNALRTKSSRRLFDEFDDEDPKKTHRLVAEYDDDEEDVSQTRPPMTAKAKKSDSREWRIFACYLYSQNRLSPSALKEPARDMLPLVTALGLKPYANGRQYMRYEDALAMVKKVKLQMPPAVRAEFAGEARRLRAQLESEQAVVGPDPPPPTTGGQTALVTARVQAPSMVPTFWRLPGFSMLNYPERVEPITSDEIALFRSNVERVFVKHQHAVDVPLDAITVAARTIRIGVRPVESDKGKWMQASKVKTYKPDLMMALKAKTLRLEIPVPGTDYVGVEFPHPRPEKITLRQMLETPQYQQAVRRSKLTVALGKDMTGVVRIADLKEMPHLLIAGTTGSGKSVIIHSIIGTILIQATPDDVRFWLIDPKQGAELGVYGGIPHLIDDVCIEADKAVGILIKAVEEMDRRYRLFGSLKMRNIDYYRKERMQRVAQGDYSLENLPEVVVGIDELYDLMLTASDEIEGMLVRIAQLGRAAGIHLVVATQHPSADVITPVLKANFPTRIGCMVASHHNSMVILDQTGAEELLGRGDMLYLAGDSGFPERMQAPFLSPEESDALAKHWRNVAQGIQPSPLSPPTPREKAGSPTAIQRPLPEMESPDQAAQELAPLNKNGDLRINDIPAYIEIFLRGNPLPFKLGDIRNNDQLYLFVKAWTGHQEEVSTQDLVLTFSIGNPRAARFMKHLETGQIVGPDPGAGRKRKVLARQDASREEANTQEEATESETEEVTP